jgi:ClpP class serine protease
MQRKLDALVSQTAQSFIAEVKDRRGARLDATTDLFSGEVWTGRESLRLGLVDEIGTLEQLLATHFEGVPSSTFVPKRRTNSFFEAILSQTVVALRDTLAATEYEVTL